jgi:benzoate 4-monooxygenase
MYTSTGCRRLRNVLEFESYIAAIMRQLLDKFDGMCDKAVKDGKGWVTFDTLPWLNYLAFDIIGECAFLVNNWVYA